MRNPCEDNARNDLSSFPPTLDEVDQILKDLMLNSDINSNKVQHQLDFEKSGYGCSFSSNSTGTEMETGFLVLEQIL